jgi:hypothetical protein
LGMSATTARQAEHLRCEGQAVAADDLDAAPGRKGSVERASQISPLTLTRPSLPCHDTVSPSAPISASLPVTTGPDQHTSRKRGSGYRAPVSGQAPRVIAARENRGIIQCDACHRKATDEGKAKGEKWCKRAIWDNTLPATKKLVKSVDNLTSEAFVDMWRDQVDHIYAHYSLQAE